MFRARRHFWEDGGKRKKSKNAHEPQSEVHACLPETLLLILFTVLQLSGRRRKKTRLVL